jgi:hypothetical protein
LVAGTAAICSNWCMTGRTPRFFCRHPFLIAGVLTVFLFFLVEAFNQSGNGDIARVLAGPLRVLVVPMYLIWLLIVIAYVATLGPVVMPYPFSFVIAALSLAAGLAPYAVADYILNRYRTRSHRLP